MESAQEKLLRLLNTLSDVKRHQVDVRDPVTLQHFDYFVPENIIVKVGIFTYKFSARGGFIHFGGPLSYGPAYQEFVMHIEKSGSYLYEEILCAFLRALSDRLIDISEALHCFMNEVMYKGKE